MLFQNNSKYINSIMHLIEIEKIIQNSEIRYLF